VVIRVLLSRSLVETVMIGKDSRRELVMSVTAGLGRNRSEMMGCHVFGRQRHRDLRAVRTRAT